MAKQYGFIIDTERCVDCRACVTACKSSNNIDLGITWRRVSSTWKGIYPNATFTSTSMACNHCAKPACIEICPTAAISKRGEDGIVVVNKTTCIGCRACEPACPFNAPQFGKDGVMQKCDLCLDRISAERKPVCVTTCPAGALIFGTMDELPKLAGKKTVRQLEGTTQPSIFVPIPGS
jgi:anaerobic dimethyl sulfoxide reductase subunit B (iron-sulfur subunit)